MSQTSGVFMRQQLIDLGYPVIGSREWASKLLKWSTNSDIAIVVSDVMMPGDLNGRQLAERIAAVNPQMQIVLMSGYADEPEFQTAGELPVGETILKQDLMQALQRASKGKEMKEIELPKRIVIVEDDPDVARIIEQVLSDFPSIQFGVVVRVIYCVACAHFP